MIEKSFLWCWDARPYPFWPDLDNIWSDGICWSRGHWLNGKLGISLLSAIVQNICKKVGINEDEIDVSELNDFVEGFVLDKIITAKEAIELLQQTYFFDVIEEEGKLKFKKRARRKIIKISSEELVPYEIAGNLVNVKSSICSEMNLPSEIKIICMNKAKDYEPFVQSATSPIHDKKRTITITSPQVLGVQKARAIAKTILDNIWQAKNSYNFMLPVKYAYLSPSDLIEMDEKIFRIIAICFQEKKNIEINCVIENIAIYKHSINEFENTNIKAGQDPGDTKLYILNLPKLPFEISKTNRLFVAAEGFEPGWKGAKVKCPNGQILVIENSIIGQVVSEIIDDKIIIILKSGEIFSVIDDQFGIKNIALIGNEIIRFEEVVKLKENIYEISKINRCLSNTIAETSFMLKDFIILDSNLHSIELADIFIGKDLEFEAVSIGRSDEHVNRFSFVFASSQS